MYLRRFNAKKEVALYFGLYGLYGLYWPLRSNLTLDLSSEASIYYVIMLPCSLSSFSNFYYGLFWPFWPLLVF